MKNLFGKDDLKLGHAGTSPSVSDFSDKHSRHTDNTQGKQLALVVAVTVTSLVIVAAWLLTLPMQLDSTPALDEESVARWYVIREQMEEEGSGFQDQLDRVKDQLEKAAVGLEVVSESNGVTGSRVLPEDLAGRLRDKIMDHESINQTEQDATTQEDQQ